MDNAIQPERYPDSESVNIWLIEDNDIYRNSIVSLIDQANGMRCRRSFRSCEEALEVLEDEFAPELILLDIGLPGMSGIEGLQRIRSISPSTRLIMLTVYDDDEKIFNAICAGASGYLLKSSPPNKIIESLQEVLRGGAPMNAEIARRVLEMFSQLARPKGEYGLTNREKEILQLMVDGLTKQTIADRLFLSYFTIDTHTKNIYTKLQVHSSSGAVAKVLKEHLL
jgi:DNA-binding NarL/FixJ family response regulator